MNVIKLIQANRVGRRVAVKAGRVGRLLGAAVITTCALAGAPMQSASAQPCPDVEVVFARGTAEPPGFGGVGQAFVDAFRAQLGDRTLGTYAVNYAASSNFAGGMDFALTVIDGIRDAFNRIQTTAATCPTTRIVVGGFSQGAVIAGFVTAAAVPDGVPAALVPQPLPPEVADHVAAVVLFGKPSDRFMRDIGAPPIVIGPLYAEKTIDLCAPGDNICDGAPIGQPNGAHNLYIVNGMVVEAATFAISKL